MENPTVPEKQEYSSAAGMLLRLYWFFMSHAAAALLGVKMAIAHEQRSPLYNAVLAGILLTTIFARYLDIRFFNGETGDCRKATMIDWRKWTILTAGCYCAGFAVLHASALLLR